MIGLVTGDDGWAPTCMLGKREREWEEGVGSGGGGVTVGMRPFSSITRPYLKPHAP